MFSYLRTKLGITELQKDIKAIPALNTRYLALLTPMEALYNLLLSSEGDDSLVMHKLRSMGLCGGWHAKELYEKGKLHGITQAELDLLRKNSSIEKGV